MDSGLKKYTVLPKSCIDQWVDSIGVPKLPDDVAEVLVEDVTYRLREAVHNSLKLMWHCKRTCLTVDDFNNSLKVAHTEPIFGHGGVDSMSFKSISNKELRVTYLDEKEINLRENALESVYPMDPGDTSLKASWLVLEGQQYNNGKTKEDERNHTLPEVISSYMNNITSALIDRSINLRKVALKDLAENKKLQITLPHLVTFLSSQAIICAVPQEKIKQHTNKVFQLVKIMLYVIVEAQMVTSKWFVKDLAAIVLFQLCRKHASILNNLQNQLLKSFQDSLNDQKRSLSSLYGAILGIKTLGPDAIYRVLYPVVKEKIQLLQTRYETTKKPETHLQIITVKSIIGESLAIMLKYRHLILSKKDFNIGEIFRDQIEMLGDEFLYRCMFSNHKPLENTCKNNLQPRATVKSSTALTTAAGSSSNSSSSVTETAKLIDENKKLIKEDSDIVMKNEDEDKICDSTMVSSLGDIIHKSLSKPLKKRRLTPKNIFSSMDSEAMNEDNDDDREQTKTTKTTTTNKRFKRDLMKGTHISFKKRTKDMVLEELTKISTYLPIM